LNKKQALRLGVLSDGSTQNYFIYSLTQEFSVRAQWLVATSWLYILV